MSAQSEIALAGRILETIEHSILPLTEMGVSAGNKVFGGALLAKSDLSLVLAETNNETDNPLWHGEVHLLKSFYEMPAAGRPQTSDLIFISTHEPCSMCLSAITWAGFDNFYYFFSHEDSRDAFSIPHDLKILKEVFGLEPGAYRHDNAYWSGRSIMALLDALPEGASAPLKTQAARIRQRYADLSNTYQAGKSGNDIPLN